MLLFLVGLYALACYFAQSGSQQIKRQAATVLKSFSRTDFLSDVQASVPETVEIKIPPPQIKRKLTQLQKKKIAAANGWKCGSCQRQLSWDYEIDHVIPLSQGGSECTVGGASEDFSNCVPKCLWCHRVKTSIENSDRIVQLRQRRPNGKTITK